MAFLDEVRSWVIIRQAETGPPGAASLAPGFRPAASRPRAPGRKTEMNKPVAKTGETASGAVESRHCFQRIANQGGSRCGEKRVGCVTPTRKRGSPLFIKIPAPGPPSSWSGANISPRQYHSTRPHGNSNRTTNLPAVWLFVANINRMSDAQWYDYPSPLAGYEDAPALPDERAADGKSFVNPSTGVLSSAYDKYIEPLDPGQGFHAHVYYYQANAEHKQYARELWERIRREFPELRIYTFWDKPVGPHPVAMFVSSMLLRHKNTRPANTAIGGEHTHARSVRGLRSLAGHLARAAVSTAASQHH